MSLEFLFQSNTSFMIVYLLSRCAGAQYAEGVAFSPASTAFVGGILLPRLLCLGSPFTLPAA